MKALKITLASALLAFAATQAAAQQTPYFKAPMDFAGTGCPAGSMTVTGENSPTLTVMFDKYDAAKPLSKARSQMERTSCNFAVPVHVPAGFQVSTLTADWMGYAEGSVELFRRYFFAGTPMPGKTSRPSGNFVERDEKLYGTVTNSPCGRDVQLRINSSVTAKSNPSYIALDTIDLQTKPMVIFKLNWQACR
ncbi:DUF4360 domain-containing protein [Candidatus Electronema sp. PJ]|uniref:DUF4360 domain-containing protein n=1 Tax=Candidatus Electronema sp. PJ TaxID=3401572 RepID=UPI003AA8EE05